MNPGGNTSFGGDNLPEIVLDSEISPTQQSALDNYLHDLERFTAQLNKLMVRDDIIDNMIYQEVRDFFTGEKTADEVANNLQSRVNLYLNE
jgi:ABC-type glycerol-3-phosphate transport system substrate-binding protein